MLRIGVHLFCILCLLLYTAEQATGQCKDTTAVIIHNAEQFNNYLDGAALRMQEKIICVFQHEELINAGNVKTCSVWYDYANAYKAAVYPKQIAEFTFQYKDNVRLLAAHCTPQLREKLTQREQQALSIAQQLVNSLIRPGMTEAQKLRALHDGIIHRSRYTKEPMGNVCDLLLNKRGTCEAYSRTLWLLCRMSGLKCHIIYGHADEPHAWNLVCIDNQWYHVDATWDDPVTVNNPQEQTLSYRYYMLNDAQMSTDHSWSTQNMPMAATKNEDFFRKNNLYFTDDGTLWAALSKAINQGHGSIEVYMGHFGSDTSLRRRLTEASYKIPTLQAITAWQGPQGQSEGVVRFIFENAGPPLPADMSHLDFSRGVIVETKLLIDNIDLQKTWEEISDTAATWWDKFVEWIKGIWEWILSQFTSEPLTHQYP